MSKLWKVGASYEDGERLTREFDAELAANRLAARLSRSKARGGPACFAVVYEGGIVRATWQDGKKTTAK